MAKLTFIQIVLLYLFLHSSHAIGDPFPRDVPDPAAVNAFQQYWHAFDKYEAKILDEGKRKYQQEWDEVKKKYDKDRQAITTGQIEKLKESAHRYKSHLDEFPGAANRPLVLLNLAQIQNILGDLLSLTDENAGSFNKKEALDYLKEIESNFPDFTYREESLYIRALILESLERNEDALAVWRNLAGIAKKSLHGVHANVAVGDHLFEQNLPKQSTRYYKQALDLIGKVDTDKRDYEKLRIEYRLAWAAYRSADLALAVKSASALLVPGREFVDVETREKIQKDAIDLVGDSLFETNNFRNSKKILMRRNLSEFAPAVGLRTLSRLAANRIHRRSIELGEFLIKKFPAAKEMPDWLTIMATAYKELGKDQKRVGALERLAMMLPAKSLWRARHRDEFSTINAMVKKAESAARLAAAHHYEHGMGSGNANSFLTAASLYELLLEHLPNTESSNEWRLRNAHCYYFANKLSDAAKLYANLKKNYKLDPKTLELASYQLVLTYDKLWRQDFAKSIAKNKNPKEDAAVENRLKDLERSVQEFANRFPSGRRSVDLLLAAASANRDIENYEEATKFWERALVSSPSHSQRGLAIRGMVLAAVKSKDNQRVILLAKRFLKLENWEAIGLSLGTELRGVLSSATFEEGTALNKQGKVQDGGMLMVQVAQEFNGIPKRNKIYRDGAYMLAIAGDWSSAQAAAMQFLSEPNTGKSQTQLGDMMYLIGRSHEFQIRFTEAAKSYLSLGRRYPRHSRAQTALARAQNLALAEGEFEIAAEAAALYAERAKNQGDRLASYEKSMDFYDQAAEPEKALAIARKRRAAAKTKREIYESDLLVARSMYEAGQESAALKAYQRLSNRIKGQRSSLGDTTYSRVMGESNLQLGNEAKQQFDDYGIFEGKGSVGAKVNQKTKYFEKMVRSYDRAAASGHVEYGPQARYELAQSAERFADELASIPLKTKGLGPRTLQKYGESADRLKKLAKRYYSSNLLVRNKNPQIYRNNQWIKKSAIRLTGYGDVDYRPEHQHQLPEAVNLEMPYQWSVSR